MPRILLLLVLMLLAACGQSEKDAPSPTPVVTHLPGTLEGAITTAGTFTMSLRGTLDGHFNSVTVPHATTYQDSGQFYLLQLELTDERHTVNIVMSKDIQPGTYPLLSQYTNVVEAGQVAANFYSFNAAAPTMMPDASGQMPMFGTNIQGEVTIVAMDADSITGSYQFTAGFDQNPDVQVIVSGVFQEIGTSALE